MSRELGFGDDEELGSKLVEEPCRCGVARRVLLRLAHLLHRVGAVCDPRSEL